MFGESVFGKFTKFAATKGRGTVFCRNSGIGGSQTPTGSLEHDYFRAFRFVLLVSAVGMFVFAGLAVGGVAAQEEISNAAELQDVQDDLDGDYVLKDDINMSGVSGFEPIGDRNDRTADRSGSPFTGTFDGNGHAVSNLTIDRPDENYVGLFGAVGSGGKVENVGIKDSEVKGDGWTGGLVGFNEGEVNRTYAGSDVSVSGSWTTGGLVGANAGEVIESFSEATVNDVRLEAGGLVGVNLNGDVRASYATGGVSGDEKVGGLVGVNFEGSIDESYAAGSVSGGDETGGLVGVSSGTVSASYWDNEATGQFSSDGGTALTTNEMQGDTAESNMAGFDFEGTWATVEDPDDYPILAWQLPNLAIDEIRPVQVVFDPDVSGDNMVDLVEKKKTAVLVFPDGENLDKLNKDTEIKIEVTTSWREELSKNITVREYKNAVQATNKPNNFIALSTAFPEGNINEVVKATVDPTNEIRERNRINNSLSEIVNVFSTRDVRIDYVRILRDEPGGDRQANFDDYREHIDGSDEFVQATFPIAESKYDSVNQGDVRIDSNLRRDYLWDLNRRIELADGGERVIGVVDKDFFNATLGPDTATGWTIPGLKSGLVEVGFWITTAHELGHTYGLYTEVEQYQEPLGQPSGYFDLNNGYWVAGGKYVPPTAPTVSSVATFMQNGGGFPGDRLRKPNITDRWIGNQINPQNDPNINDSIDFEDYNFLFNEFYEGTKTFSTLETTNTRDTSGILISGMIHKNRTADILAVDRTNEVRKTLQQDGDGFKIMGIDKEGDELSSKSFSVSFRALVTGVDEEGEQLPPEELSSTPFLVYLEYDGELAEVRLAEEGNIISEFDPNIELLRTTVESIPQDGFEHQNAAEQRRNALLNKIGALENMLEAGNTRGAVRKMENDIKPSLDRWLEDEYETESMLQLTKDEVLTTAEAVTERLRAQPSDTETGGEEDNAPGEDQGQENCIERRDRSRGETAEECQRDRDFSRGEDREDLPRKSSPDRDRGRSESDYPPGREPTSFELNEEENTQKLLMDGGAYTEADGTETVAYGTSTITDTATARQVGTLGSTDAPTELTFDVDTDINPTTMNLTRTDSAPPTVQKDNLWVRVTFADGDGTGSVTRDISGDEWNKDETIQTEFPSVESGQNLYVQLFYESSGDATLLGSEIVNAGGFEVDIKDEDVTLAEGALYEPEVRINNTASEEDTQTITLDVEGDQKDSTELTLGPGESKTINSTTSEELSWSTAGVLDESESEADFDVNVSSEDDSDTTEVKVAELKETSDGFKLSREDVPSQVGPGETIKLDIRVTNEANKTLTQTVLGGVGLGDTGFVKNEKKVLTLGPGESTVVTFGNIVPEFFGEDILSDDRIKWGVTAVKRESGEFVVVTDQISGVIEIVETERVCRNPGNMGVSLFDFGGGTDSGTDSVVFRSLTAEEPPVTHEFGVSTVPRSPGVDGPVSVLVQTQAGGVVVEGDTTSSGQVSLNVTDSGVRASATGDWRVTSSSGVSSSDYPVEINTVEMRAVWSNPSIFDSGFVEVNVGGQEICAFTSE